MVRRREAVGTRDHEFWGSKEAKISQSKGSPKHAVIRQCKIKRIKITNIIESVKGGLFRRGRALETLNTTHHSLQARKIKERVRKSIFYVERMNSWQVDLDGSRPLRISQEGGWKAQSPFIRRARRTICLKLGHGACNIFSELTRRICR